jgi:hypothetical protein
VFTFGTAKSTNSLTENAYPRAPPAAGTEPDITASKLRLEEARTRTHAHARIKKVTKLATLIGAIPMCFH